VRSETGRTLHQKGRILPVCQGDGGGAECYIAAFAAVLRSELGGTRAAAKTMMRWTGAGERTVKAWLSGVSGPSGEHLIALMRRSDAVFALVLRLTGRADDHGQDHITVARRHLVAALTALDRTAGHAEGQVEP
jgi:hypothetical protein